MILKRIKKEYGKIAYFVFIIGFMMISLPLYATNKLIDYIKIFNTDINIFHIAISLILIYMVINYQNIYKIPKTYFLIFILFVIIIFHLVFGFMINNSLTYILRDLNLYILPILVFSIFYTIFRKKDFKFSDLLDYFFYAVMINATINILMILTSNISFWGITNYAGDRFGGSYLSNIIFIFWYVLYRDRYRTKNNNNKLLNIYFILITLGSIILSQSRALLILVVIQIPIVYQQSIFISKYKVNKRNLLVFIIVFYLLLIWIIVFFQSEFKIVDRLINLNLFSEDDSGMIRYHIYKENLKLFIKNPLGLGLGTLFPYHDGYGNILGYSNFIDNALITFGEKLGIGGLIIYIYLVLYSPINFLVQEYKHSKNKIYLFSLIAFLLYLVNTMFLTAQAINGIGVSTLLWIFSAYSVSRSYIKHKEGV